MPTLMARGLNMIKPTMLASIIYSNVVDYHLSESQCGWFLQAIAVLKRKFLRIRICQVLVAIKQLEKTWNGKTIRVTNNHELRRTHLASTDKFIITFIRTAVCLCMCVYCLQAIGDVRLTLWPMGNLNVNIGSGNGLVPSGSKPLPEPMLTQISVAIWHHQATMC